MSQPLIQTTNLNFAFSNRQPILHALNLQVPKGSVYGFLGPNGAGKTTTLRLLLGLLKSQQGSISIFGQDFAEHRISILKRLGSLIEQPSLYLHLTGKENLEVFRLTWKQVYASPRSYADIFFLKELLKRQSYITVFGL